MSIMRARSGPTSSSAPTRRAARRCAPTLTARAAARATACCVMGALGFENAYALAMRRRPRRGARRRARSTISPAPRRGSRLGADLEFLTRPEWRSVAGALRPALRRASAPTARPSCTARSPTARPTSSPLSPPTAGSPRSISSPSPIRAARCRATTRCCWSRRAAPATGLIAALRPLIGAIPVERMRQANLMVDRDADKRTPAEAARWLDPADLNAARPFSRVTASAVRGRAYRGRRAISRAAPRISGAPPTPARDGESAAPHPRSRPGVRASAAPRTILDAGACAPLCARRISSTRGDRSSAG